MGLIKCPDCRITISDDVEYCPACGRRMKTQTIYPGRPKVRAIPTYCSYCGETVPAGKRTCPGCGSPAKISYVPASDTPETPSSAALGKPGRRRK